MNAAHRGFFHFSIATPRPAVTAVLLLLLIFLVGCDYGRMKDDEALRTYKTAIPEMPKKTIPITDGIQVLREANPDELLNPLPFESAVVDRGKEKYGYYCVQCHGLNADGLGTVGQSFAPLPANLTITDVQDQSDGWLFYKMSMGFNRHPPMWFTVAEEDRWAIVWFIRSLAPPERR